MQFGVLGPLLACGDDGTERPITASRQRALLAVLLLRANRVVPSGDLADVLWDGEPPPGARATLRNYVRLLRRALGPAMAARLVTRPPGYLIEVRGDELDLVRFTEFCRLGRSAIHDRRWVTASERFTAAIDLWRGPPFTDVASRAVLRAELCHLQELGVQARESRIEADLHRGHHGQLVAELRQLVTEHPLRERLWEQLMIALYLAGRQGEALAAYHEVRAILDAELGVGPGAGLQETQRRILVADPGLLTEHAAPETGTGTPPAAPPPARAPAQLPMDTPGFTGRAGELATLDAAGDAAGRAPTAVVVCAITGTAGVGKTALALHWAHRIRDRFPDGQLYVNLRGFDPGGTQVTPGAAVRGFLHGLGVPAAGIPEGLDAQVALYRSELANRRVLVVLDNARDAQHVRPLLPGSPGCLVVVTSRDQLRGLVAAEGAHHLGLGLFSAAEADELLAYRLGRDRLAADPDGVAEVVARCARLPLALAVAAARAATQPTLSLADLAKELRAVQRGLDALDVGDAHTDVRSVFSWSYRLLSDDAARLFRLLGMHPGPDVSTFTAGSLAAMPVGRVRPLLAELAGAHLVSEPVAGRYSFHDLLRAYATELALDIEAECDRDAAVHRLLNHYTHTGHRAARTLHPNREEIVLADVLPGVIVERFPDHEHAAAWFATEHATLLAVLRLAADRSDRYTWQLSRCTDNFFDRRGHWQDWVTTQLAALAATRRLGDPTAEAHVRCSLARAYTRLGRSDAADAELRHAITLSRRSGDRVVEAIAVEHVGLMYHRQGRHVEALDHCLQAYELYRATGRRFGEANCLNAMGWLHAQLGDFAQALAPCERAVVVLQELGDRNALSSALDSLGYIHHHLGNHADAMVCYERALDLTRALGDRMAEGIVLDHLGDSRAAAGDPDAADAAWRAALTIFDVIAQPSAERVRAKLRPALRVDAG